MDMIKNSFEKIQSQAHQDGVKVEMLISGGENLKIGFQKKEMNSFESTQSQMAGLRVIVGASQGYAYTENLAEDSLLRTYSEALKNARTVQKQDSFEVPLQKPTAYQPMNDLFVAEEIPMDQKIEVARNLEEKCLAADSRVQGVPYSGFNEVRSFKRVLNSEGLDHEYKQSYYVGYAYSLVKQDESSKMDAEGFFSRHFKNINVDEVSQNSVRKAVSRLGAKSLKTGNYPVVICRDQFTQVLAMIEGYFSAKEVDEGKSLFQGKLGDKIASEKFYLSDDPFAVNGSNSRPFDDEGSPSQKTVLFAGGVLANYLTNVEYAKKMNLPQTASASRSPSTSLGISVSNLVVKSGSKSLLELLASYPKVVYLTEFSGGLHSGFKESTGDISMPAEGFLYENGKCVGPVDQFVMSGNVLDLLRDIEEVGNEYNKPGNSMICPDVLVKSMSFAGA